MRTRITHIWMTPGVVAGDRNIPFLRDAEILIDGNRIVYAGKREEAPAFEAEQVIDGKGALAMPGLCNLHTHTPMTLFRQRGSRSAAGSLASGSHLAAGKIPDR